MIFDEERKALRLWFDAFDPAVHVDVTDDAVCLWSTRSNRSVDIVRYPRTQDLHQDLNGALSHLVHRIS